MHDEATHVREVIMNTLSKHERADHVTKHWEATA